MDLQTLSIWLNRHPQIRLDKLSWLAEGRTLTLAGTTTPANFARFIRDLAAQNVAHKTQQSPAEEDAAFHLSIYFGRDA